ncbi:hypothetical protein [Nodularia sphaerocarpa]|uniref:hypothetical protein n=1 Tax=Nodularia sphaerocarpa TaxID=137816 RepID=UPI001EFB292A|nr:hypothetical protein [Nodularia sphaerocarpa]MDB9375752.1 hypothetical protein [Nodularia sphaerocarpa CS-585]MDB9377234.1 hypothetical protein [Nodularia sphaerocarpa CS-585A2]ULP73105.1 hypothetical protein BDGGKGIB_02758 [Nodularia sphaerocarpa UHCC 0038]
MSLIETESGIILPGHPFFDEYLYSSLPPGWGNFAFKNPDFAFIARSGSGVLEAVDDDTLDEYVYGGEYDLLLDERGEDDGYNY